jgi:hypothetical protein
MKNKQKNQQETNSLKNKQKKSDKKKLFGAICYFYFSDSLKFSITFSAVMLA